MYDVQSCNLHEIHVAPIFSQRVLELQQNALIIISNHNESFVFHLIIDLYSIVLVYFNVGKVHKLFLETSCGE